MQKEKLRSSELIQHYRATRLRTERLCEPLVTEDYVIQSIEDVSPPKWHLAHTTWFFEAFLLDRFVFGYRPFNREFHRLFNSYYQTLGDPYPRAKRGLLSRPTVAEVIDYRHAVDDAVMACLSRSEETLLDEITPIVVLGLQHEEQHQELLLMDIKYNFSINPLFPVYLSENDEKISSLLQPMRWLEAEGGIVSIGHDSKTFCFDNETPQYETLLRPYALGSRLVTNGEYLAFIQEGGYQQSIWWLSDGYEAVQKHHWQAPLYWQQIDNEWYLFTLSGLKPLNLDEPVSHVSFFEAEAYARYRGARLPLEAEWENYVRQNHINPHEGHFMDSKRYHPKHAASPICHQFMGDLWEWTQSAYLPYPGYKPLNGSLGEYNGKFMNNQFVLKGGACVTPASHIRVSYRNFFQPDKRWQFSGIRLAEDR